MKGEMTQPSWPPMTGRDIATVVSKLEIDRSFFRAGASDISHKIANELRLLWVSPRPMSAAVIIEIDNKKLFIKRHHCSVRNYTDIMCEHELIIYLCDHLVNVPFLHHDQDGKTAICQGEFIYEVSDTASGIDLYRDRISWSPYLCTDHSYNAGKALAKLHNVIKGFKGKEREFNVLRNSVCIIMADDPLAQLKNLMDNRPTLAESVINNAKSINHFFDRFSEIHLPYIEKLAQYKQFIRPCYIHGDWHPSNMMWTKATKDADVTSIFDFNLANLSFFQHDIAIAIERSFIDWLYLSDPGVITWDRQGLKAFLAGYSEIAMLHSHDLELIADLLPICHFEYGLSEVEYFSHILHQSENALLAYESYLFGHSKFFYSAAAIQDEIRNFSVS